MKCFILKSIMSETWSSQLTLNAKCSSNQCKEGNLIIYIIHKVNLKLSRTISLLRKGWFLTERWSLHVSSEEKFMLSNKWISLSTVSLLHRYIYRAWDTRLLLVVWDEVFYFAFITAKEFWLLWKENFFEVQ